MANTAERPAYRILSTNGFFSPDDELIEEGSEIYFDGEPNEEMEPLNEPARVKLTAYLEQLDEYGRLAAEKAGRPWVGRPRNLDGALNLATEVQRMDMAIMGAKKETKSVDKVEKADTPQTGKRGRGRPRLNIA